MAAWWTFPPEHRCLPASAERRATSSATGCSTPSTTGARVASGSGRRTRATGRTITVALDANTNPIFAAYSQHCSGTVRAWSKVTRMQTHPIDYVALGSHANYFTQTSSPTQFLRCVYKNVAKADRSKARRLVSAVQSGITDRTGTAHRLGPTTEPADDRYNSSTWTARCPPGAASPAAGAKANSSGSAEHQPASRAYAAVSDPRRRAGTPHRCRRSGTPTQARALTSQTAGKRLNRTVVRPKRRSSLVCVRAYALAELGDREAVEVFLRREDAFAALDVAISDEPDSPGLRYVVPIELDERELSAN